ncbi:hypothetical protein ACJMK2_013064 [Sinanodonta woodiana]|uniref:M-phase inducer phosphatase n=1 Tax=Sinanodonta woodiana TaxID=1069815 RepID=A0ABD3VD63_SINWO
MEDTGSLQRKDHCPASSSSLDDDSGLGMEIDQGHFLTRTRWICPLHDVENMDDPKPESRRPSAPLNSLHIRCLFKNKDSLYQDQNVSSPSKRFRDESQSPMPSSWTISTNLSPCSDTTCTITEAVDRMTFDSGLIADGSRTYSLPTVPSSHSDLKCISTQTMAAVLRGEFAGIDKGCTIIDCRYPYEFHAGHIAGAVNLYTEEAMQQFLFQMFDERYSAQRRTIIFYCEFSSVRGPKMYRFLRGQDRHLHQDKYPILFFPEVYLLEGGYKAFYEEHKLHCEPMGYTPMSQKDHGAKLRHFQTKSKSWPAAHRRQDRHCHKQLF